MKSILTNSFANSDMSMEMPGVCDHILQIYSDDKLLMDGLCKYTEEGISFGENVIIIATSAHLSQLDNRLQQQGLNTADLISGKRFFALDAQLTLDKFMINQWPDEDLFTTTVSTIVQEAGFPERGIRTYGEMVALLWADGLHGATVHLEQLWNRFCAANPFMLYCAYPEKGFSAELQSSLQHICRSHTKVMQSTG